MPLEEGVTKIEASPGPFPSLPPGPVPRTETVVDVLSTNTIVDKSFPNEKEVNGLSVFLEYGIDPSVPKYQCTAVSKLHAFVKDTLKVRSSFLFVLALTMTE